MNLYGILLDMYGSPPKDRRWDATNDATPNTRQLTGTEPLHPFASVLRIHQDPVFWGRCTPLEGGADGRRGNDARYAQNENALDRAAGNWTPSDHAYRTADMRESDFAHARF